MSVLKYWLWLSTLHGIGPRTAKKLIDYFGSPKDIYFAREKHYAAAGISEKAELKALEDKNLDRASRIWRDCDELDIRLLTIQDAEYPQRLLNIYDPPTVLYIKGRLPVIDEEVVVAMVGTRGATPYGLRVTERLAYEVTKGGGLIVSGLAEGIDTVAILGALRAGGKPLAVLGTGIDVYYPPKNKLLQDDVAQTGALISEYPPGTLPARSNFPARNRIISGVSVGVTIIEAPAKSGALITASRAMEQGRDVFVVPGNIDSPACQGSNALLKENCALAVTSGRDILREYDAAYPQKLIANTEDLMTVSAAGQLKNPENTATAVPLSQESTEKVVDKTDELEYIDLKEQLENLSEDELSVVSVMSSREMHIDDIIDLSQCEPSRVLSALTALELKGYAVSGKGRRYSLIISKDKK
ncbi:MAG: DNA-protecting protein DprA [Clostridiales bacterium]|jgi:DNA processing protein|nr:DNA-protecting protein DprA [Clostridiales bacterium]